MVNPYSIYEIVFSFVVKLIVAEFVVMFEVVMVEIIGGVLSKYYRICFWSCIPIPNAILKPSVNCF